MQNKNLIVIGGGAAGFFCAINAAQQALAVTILEKTNKVLSKVKVSGGGRCNVTHACLSIAEMIKHYPRGGKFLKESFHHFFTDDTIHWFAERGVQLKTEADGRMFPVTDSSGTIINCLMQEANKNHVEILMNSSVERVRIDEDKEFIIRLSNGSMLRSDLLCIASGGFAKEHQYEWLQSLGHNFQKPVPSLFTFNIPEDNITQLMGISVNDVMVKINGTKFSQQGSVLITHWGLSGPAILTLSSFAAKELAGMHYNFLITINWLSSYNETSIIEKLKEIKIDNASRKMMSKNPFLLPHRFWEYHLKICGIPDDLRWADISSKQQNKLAKQLCAQQFGVKGKTTFKEEFVTAGGINLNEINAATMQSKIVPNLFFAGEIMDVDGVTGGYNFQHAWTSGWLAAKEIKRIASAKTSLTHY